MTTGQRSAGPINHGTNAGYNQHRQRGQVACEECLSAHREYNLARAPKPDPSNGGRYQRRITPETIAHGTTRGYHQHRRLGVEQCVDCKSAHSRDMEIQRKSRGAKPAKPTLRRGNVEVPLDLFINMYWTAGVDAVDKIDELYGADRVELWIKANEEAQGG